MSSNFVNNTILLNGVEESKVKLPSDSKSVKVFFDPSEKSLKYIDYSGKIYKLDQKLDGQYDESRKLIKKFVEQLDKSPIAPWDIQSLAQATNELITDIKKQVSEIDTRKELSTIVAELAAVRGTSQDITRKLLAELDLRIAAIPAPSIEALKVDVITEDIEVAYVTFKDGVYLIHLPRAIVGASRGGISKSAVQRIVNDAISTISISGGGGSGYDATLRAEVGVVTGALVADIVAVSASLNNYTLLTVTDSLTSNLQSQINNTNALVASTSANVLAISEDRFVNVAGDIMTGTLACTGASIDTDINYIPSWKEGRVFYDSNQHTLAYYNDNSDVTVNLGAEMLVAARNSTGSLISNGTVVCISGSSGSHPLLRVADANIPDLAHCTLGVATHNISHNENGYVTISGRVHGLNTSTITGDEGDVLWLDANGTYTTVTPQFPTHKVKVGYLIRKHNTQGIILVSLDTGLDLSDIHDVSLSSPLSGDYLAFDGNKWINKNISSDLAPYIFKSEVANISAGLVTLVAGTSGVLQSNINSEIINRYAADATISGSLVSLIVATSGSLAASTATLRGEVASISAKQATINQDIYDNLALTVRVTGDQLINGNKTLNGNTFINNDLTVSGNLSVAGGSFIVNAQQISASDNIIMLNAGETGGGVTNVSAGISIDRGTQPDYFFIFNEVSDTFRIGEETTTQAVATREDTPIDGGVAVWDNSTSKFNTSLAYAKTTEVANISAFLQSEVVALSGELNTILAKAGEPQGFENRTDSSISFNEGTRTFSISGSYYIWQNGKRYLNSGHTQQISNTVGNHYFYYDTNANFVYSTTAFNILTDVPMAIVYWDGTNGILFEERHGIVMDRVTHKYLHFTRGTQYESGLSINYQENIDSIAGVSYSINSGVIADEDLQLTLSAQPSGSYTIIYRSGSTSYSISASNLPFLVNSTNISYNQFSSPNWIQTQLTNNGEYVNYYVFATTAISGQYQTFAIPGQATYTTLAGAQAETISQLNLTGLPIIEFNSIYKITYERKNAYGTANGKAVIASVERIVNNSVSLTSIAASTNHNSLSGLQGGTAGEYYHLTAAQASDFIGASTVASISASLLGTSRATSSALYSLIAGTSGVLQNNISLITAASGNYVDLSTNQSISGTKSFTTGISIRRDAAAVVNTLSVRNASPSAGAFTQILIGNDNSASQNYIFATSSNNTQYGGTNSLNIGSAGNVTILAGSVVQQKTTSTESTFYNPIVIGTDPGGSEKLRVGGGIRTDNQSTFKYSGGNTLATIILDTPASGTQNGIAFIDYAQAKWSIFKGTDNNLCFYNYALGNYNGWLTTAGDTVIGTTDPGGSEKLRVGGSARISGATCQGTLTVLGNGTTSVNVYPQLKLGYFAEGGSQTVPPIQFVQGAGSNLNIYQGTYWNGTSQVICAGAYSHHNIGSTGIYGKATNLGVLGATSGAPTYFTLYPSAFTYYGFENHSSTPRFTVSGIDGSTSIGALAPGGSSMLKVGGKVEVAGTVSISSNGNYVELYTASTAAGLRIRRSFAGPAYYSDLRQNADDGVEGLDFIAGYGTGIDAACKMAPGGSYFKMGNTGGKIGLLTNNSINPKIDFYDSAYNARGRILSDVTNGDLYIQPSGGRYLYLMDTNGNYYAFLSGTTNYHYANTHDFRSRGTATGIMEIETGSTTPAIKWYNNGVGGTRAEILADVANGDIFIDNLAGRYTYFRDTGGSYQLAVGNAQVLCYVPLVCNQTIQAFGNVSITKSDANLDLYVNTAGSQTGSPSISLRTDGRYDKITHEANGIRLTTNYSGTPHTAELNTSGQFLIDGVQVVTSATSAANVASVGGTSTSYVLSRPTATSGTISATRMDWSNIHTYSVSTSSYNINSSEKHIPYETEDYDTAGAWNGWQFVVPATGLYSVSANLAIANSATARQLILRLYVSGNINHEISNTETNNTSVGFSKTMMLEKDYVLQFKALTDSSTQTAHATSSAKSNMSISRLPGYY